MFGSSRAFHLLNVRTRRPCESVGREARTCFFCANSLCAKEQPLFSRTTSCQSSDRKSTDVIAEVEAIIVDVAKPVLQEAGLRFHDWLKHAKG